MTVLIILPPPLCVQSQVFPIQQPVQQQLTEEPTYEVEDGPCTTHSGQPLRLPTSRLTEGKGASFFFLFFFTLPLGPVLFVIPPSATPPPNPATCSVFPSAPPPSHTHATASPECQCSESAERCMPGSPHSTAHCPPTPTPTPPPHPRPQPPPTTPFTLTACRIDRPTDRPGTALRRVFLFARTHGKFGSGRRCVFEQRLPVLGGMGGSLLKTFKKKNS